MNVIPRDKEPFVPPYRLVVLIALILLTAITACTPPNDSTTATNTDATKSISTPVPTVATPNPTLEPPAALIEQPLHGLPANVPEVWLVPSLQSKEALAAHLMTDVAQLDWVNPGLPAQVSPGTLVVVPPNHLARTHTVSSAEHLLAVGPNMGAGKDLSTVIERGGR